MQRVLNYQGKLINPLNLQMSDLDNLGMQLAITLSRINRFWGQTRETYSVAQHCLSLVKQAKEDELDNDSLKYLLGHEVYEGLTGMDIPSPIKHSEAMKSYREAEDRCIDMFVQKYSICKTDIKLCKNLDKRVMIMEAEALMPYNQNVNWRANKMLPYGRLYKLGADEKEIREDFINEWYDLFGTLQ